MAKLGGGTRPACEREGGGHANGRESVHANGEGGGAHGGGATHANGEGKGVLTHPPPVRMRAHLPPRA